eukprot:SAG11_NODE_3669_length_2296_cov_1.153846_3_plen_51_part_00
MAGQLDDPRAKTDWTAAIAELDATLAMLEDLNEEGHARIVTGYVSTHRHS